MPEKKTLKKAQNDLRAGKSPTTAAGEFVHEEIEHVREGKHGARSTKQAIAIGLSKARRAGVPLPPPKRGQSSRRTRESAERAYEVGQGERKPRPSARRSRAVKKALKREPKSVVSRTALSRQAKSAARRRSKSASPRARTRSKSASPTARTRSKPASAATRTSRKSGSSRGRARRSSARS